MHSLCLLMAPPAAICPSQKLSPFPFSYSLTENWLSHLVYYIFSLLSLKFLLFSIPVTVLLGSNSHPSCLRLFFSPSIFLFLKYLHYLNQFSMEWSFENKCRFMDSSKTQYFHKSKYNGITKTVHSKIFIFFVYYDYLNITTIVICHFPNMLCPSWESVYLMVKSVGSLGRDILV